MLRKVANCPLHELRKFKGRTVFQGNNVRDENSDVALFSELGSSPATMEAGKAVDTYGAQPGFTTEQADGKQAYTQALMKGVETWVELPRDRWPKSWVGKYDRPACRLRIALYGHPDSGGLWEQRCADMLVAVGFAIPDPEGWPSVFFHANLRLLLIVYVDDFKMSGPKDSLQKGWSLIASKIDLDTPGPVGRYLGCEHIYKRGVTLPVEAHPFAHVFDKRIPDPAAKTAAAGIHRTQDFWEHHPDSPVYAMHHVQPRKQMFVPKESLVQDLGLSNVRCTYFEGCAPEGGAEIQWDHITDRKRTPSLWTGVTYLFTKDCGDPKLALAGVTRDKGSAKKAARSQNFSYLDQLRNTNACVTKPVTVVTYDMEPFLKSCVDRYVALAGKNAQSLRKVATPFHEERIARPTVEGEEKPGVLAPIAMRVLMKVLFAARMARFDLLRAVQGLAARVTKWSTDCDKALHRLICYINSTVDYKMHCFIGDDVSECRLWLFADADHAGEYDSRSTGGCVLVLVGPNTYYPLTAFSKKQTSVSLSSTESEVVSANVSLRSVGLPSSGLWAHLQQAGGITPSKSRSSSSKLESLPRERVRTEPDKDGDYWIYEPSRRCLSRVHVKPRSHLYVPSDSKSCPVSINRLGLARTTLMVDDKGNLDLKQDNWKSKGDYPIRGEWKGKTLFRVYGPNDVYYKVESQEIRESLTDWEFLGMEREGSLDLTLFAPKSIEGVFVEDNQATIRILESGKSPAFRHTDSDKTQRVNLSWLEEQFRRKWYRLVHGPTILQAADIFTKPFTKSEKWGTALRLLSIRDRLPIGQSQVRSTPAKPSVAEAHAVPDAQRLLVEVCCDQTSKLSDRTRPAAEGCRVLQFTEAFDFNSSSNRKLVIAQVKHHIKARNVESVLVWVEIGKLSSVAESLPSSGRVWSSFCLSFPVSMLPLNGRGDAPIGAYPKSKS